MSVSGIANNGFNVLLGQVKSLSGLSSTKMSASDVERLSDVKAGETNVVSKKADNNQEDLYAEVKVSGKVVASIWKSGLVELPNSYAYLSSEIGSTSSASDRAAQIAKALGGEVSYASNAKDSPSYSFSESLKQILNSY